MPAATAASNTATAISAASAASQATRFLTQQVLLRFSPFES